MSIFQPEYNSNSNWDINSDFSIGLDQETPQMPRKVIPPTLSQISDQLQALRRQTYKQPISIYHYSESLVPFQMFRRTLGFKSAGYIHSLISDDPMLDVPVQEGDELPEGCMEVIYLPGVLRFKGKKGSALGFRLKDAVDVKWMGKNDKKKVEWLCFNRFIDDDLENWAVDVENIKMGADGHVNGVLCEKFEGEANIIGDGDGANTKLTKLFDKVASLDRPAGRQPYGSMNEYRFWYNCVNEGRYKPTKMWFTWKRQDEERKEWLEEKAEEGMENKERREREKQERQKKMKFLEAKAMEWSVEEYGEDDEFEGEGGDETDLDGEYVYGHDEMVA